MKKVNYNREVKCADDIVRFYFSKDELGDCHARYMSKDRLVEIMIQIWDKVTIKWAVPDEIKDRL
jgi:hypothetical protein